MRNLRRQAVRDHLIRYGGDSFPHLFRSASGTIVVDDTGRAVLDFTSGQMCATIGHNHPAIKEAIRKSADTAMHMFSGMIPEAVADLAIKLAEWVPEPLSKSLMVNTGSESNEAALRIAKLATGGYEVVALGGSWHGTTGASAAASFASDRRGYGPKVPGNHAIPEPNAYRCPIEHCRDHCEYDLHEGRSQNVRHGIRWCAGGGYCRADHFRRWRDRPAQGLFYCTCRSMSVARHVAYL